MKYFLGYVLFVIANKIELRHHKKLRYLSELFENSRRYGLILCGAKIYKSSYIRHKLYIVNIENLQVGSRTKIGPMSQLYLYDKLEIGDDVEIGSSLIVHTAEHKFDDRNKPLAKQGARYQEVKIGSNVYIGSRVTILPGVIIHDNVIVAAGSVVTKTLESGFIYGGVPSKKIRSIR